MKDDIESLSHFSSVSLYRFKYLLLIVFKVNFNEGVWGFNSTVNEDGKNTPSIISHGG